MAEPSAAEAWDLICADEGRQGECTYCARATPWLSLSFECWLCPGNCWEQTWRGFEEAMRVKGKVENLFAP